MMKDFVLQDVQTQIIDEKVCLKGDISEYHIIKQDDVVIINDSIKNRDGAIFITYQNENICFSNGVYSYSMLCDIAKLGKDNNTKDLNQTLIVDNVDEMINNSKEVMLEYDIFGSLKSNVVYTKDFNQKAAISSKQIGDFFGNNYILKKNIYINDCFEKIFFLRDILKISSKINLKITLKDYEQSKDSIGFDGEINSDFDYKYSVNDERLDIIINIENNSINILDRFYYKHNCDNFSNKTFSICINDNILYEIKVIKRN